MCIFDDTSTVWEAPCEVIYSLKYLNNTPEQNSWQQSRSMTHYSSSKDIHLGEGQAVSLISAEGESISYLWL